MHSQVYVSSKLQDFKYHVVLPTVLKFIRYGALLKFLVYNCFTMVC